MRHAPELLGLIVALSFGTVTSGQHLNGISGITIDDQLFVAYAPKPNHASELVRATADDGDPRLAWRTTTRIPYNTPIRGFVRGGISKITISHDRFWVIAPGDELFHAIPIDDLHYFEDNDWAEKRERAKFGKRSINIGGPYGYWVNHLFIPGDDKGQNAIQNVLEELAPKGFGDKHLDIVEYSAGLVRDDYYDLIPTGADTFLFVHLTTGMVHLPKDSLVIQEMKLGSRTVVKENVHTKPLPDTKPLTIKAPFEGDFWAYEIDGVYYLLTRKGKLYAVRKNKDTLVTATVWDDEKRPLIGAIQDVGRKTVIAFGTAGKDGERIAFDMAFEPKVCKYKTDAKPADGFREAQDAVRAVKPKPEPKK